MASSEENKKKETVKKTNSQTNSNKKTSSKTSSAKKSNNTKNSKTTPKKKTNSTKANIQTAKKKTNSNSQKKPVAKKQTPKKEATKKTEVTPKEVSKTIEVDEKTEVKEVVTAASLENIKEEKVIKDDFTFNTKASELQKLKDERERIEKEEKTPVPKKEKVTSLLGIELPTSKEDKAKRRKIYKRESLTFAIMLPIIDLFAMLFFKKYTYVMFTNNVTMNYIITLVIDFVLVYFVTYLFDYILSEDSIKKSK